MEVLYGEPWRAALSTIIQDNLFCADSSHFSLYFVKNFIWGWSEQDDFLLELEDWVRAGKISVGAGILIFKRPGVARAVL